MQKKNRKATVNLFLATAVMATAVAQVTPQNVEASVNTPTTVASTTTSTKYLPAKYDIDPFRKWTIQLSDKIDARSVTPRTVYIKDMWGNQWDLPVKLGTDQKSIILEAPQDGYFNGDKYTIHVTTGVKSSSGKNLKQAIAMDFTIKALVEEELAPLVPPPPEISTPTNPEPTQPVPTNPVPTNPVPTNPVPTNPVPTQPVPTNPVPTNPVPTQPVPTNPVPTNPTPMNPTYPVETQPVTTKGTFYDFNGVKITDPARIQALIDKYTSPSFLMLDNSGNAVTDPYAIHARIGYYASPDFWIFDKDGKRMTDPYLINEVITKDRQKTKEDYLIELERIENQDKNYHSVRKQFPDSAFAQAMADWLTEGLGREVTIYSEITKAMVEEALESHNDIFYPTTVGITNPTGLDIFEGTNVGSINLWGNPITELTLPYLPNLVIIGVERTKVTKINNLENAPKLVTIKVSGTSLNPEDFKNYPNITLRK